MEPETEEGPKLDDYPEFETDAVVPFFQPVVSLQTRHIIGYESLGRVERNGSLDGLGKFFSNLVVAPEDQRRVDRRLREMAFSRFATHTEPDLLFLNVRPSWMYRYWKKHHSLRTVEMIEDHRIDPSRIVVEIAGDFHQKDATELAGIVDQYRQSGCQIAMDDVGSSFGHLDWIATFHPNFIKVNLRSFAGTIGGTGSDALMRGYALFAEQVGASLVVVGVESEDELRYCLRLGARLVQGFFFSEALRELLPPDTYEPRLDRLIAQQRETTIGAYEGLFASIERMRARFPDAAMLETEGGIDAFLEEAVMSAPETCIRAYLCDRNGTQLSSNWTRSANGVWERDPSYRGSNWSWRPYSLSNTVMMTFEKRGTLSAPYKDLETKQTVHTYSYPLADNSFLFLDFIDPTT